MTSTGDSTSAATENNISSKNPAAATVTSTTTATTSTADNNNNEAAPTTTTTTTTTTPTTTSTKPTNDQDGPVGCYLTYESSSGGRLMLHYSKGSPVPDNAVGFWCPGPNQTIQEFKFKQAAGRSELIKGIAGGDANRRKYYSGWCQFLKLAKQKQGRVIQFTPAAGQYVAVDVYAYSNKLSAPVLLNLEEGLVDITSYDAIAVMAKHHAFLKGVKTIVESNFLELGNLAGAATKM